MWKIIVLFILSGCIFAEGVKGDEDDIKIGDECGSDSDCGNITNAYCNYDDICECEEGYLASFNNSSCLRLATKVGDKCEVIQQCSAIPSASCLNKTCVVFQASTTSQSIAKPKEECTEDSQCSSFLIKRICKNGTCVLGLPEINQKSAVGNAFVLGKPCSNDTECSSEGAACFDKVCKCKENFVTSQDLQMCLPKVTSVGGKCKETAQCLSLNNSICENEKCTQKNILSSFSEKILPLLIGSTCQTDNECKHLTHALCLENVCQCKDNYITSVTSNSCLEMAKKEGDPCEIDKQCSDIKGAVCVQKKCVKPGVVGAKLGMDNAGSAQTVSKLILGAVLCIKMFFV